MRRAHRRCRERSWWSGCLRCRCAAGHVADAAGGWRGVTERWVGFPDCGAPTQGSTRQGSASLGYDPEGRWPSRQGRLSMAQDVIDSILVRENLAGEAEVCFRWSSSFMASAKERSRPFRTSSSAAAMSRRRSASSCSSRQATDSAGRSVSKDRVCSLVLMCAALLLTFGIQPGTDGRVRGGVC